MRRFHPTVVLYSWLLFEAITLLGARPLSAQSNKLTVTLGGITFDSAYDNGSLGAISLVGSNEYDATLYTESGEKGTRKYWFRFTMSGVAGRTVTLNMESVQAPVPVLRIVSPEPGTWRRLTPAEVPDGNTLQLSFGTNTSSAELAFFEPLGYQETIAAVTNLTAASPFATVTTLGKSFESRDLHLVTVNNTAYPNAGKYRVWVHARVHAGEITSTYTMLGFLEQILENSETGRRLREYVTFHIVPQVNVDGIYHGYTRWDAQGIDLESEWCNIRTPEVALLRSQVDSLMAEINPISVALNLHSTVGDFTDSFFFKHVSPSVTATFEDIQQAYIDAVDASTPLFDNLSAQTSQLNACTFIESYFWNNWGESVMALTHEGHYYRRITDNAWTDGAHYREIGRALARGLIAYYHLPPSSEPDPTPEFTSQPASQVVALEQPFTFSANSTSAPPATYQWWGNGEAILNATNVTYSGIAASLNQSGSYLVTASNIYGSVTSSLARLIIIDTNGAAVAFADNFDSESETRWIQRAGYASGGPDYTADFAFDYSSYFSTFNNGSIPSAPGAGTDSTRGLKLTVNDNDAVGALAAVCLFPQWQSFESTHSLKFDMWINYPGGAAGSGASGSTENALFGLNHSGDHVIWDNASAAPSDGVWFTVTGEGGSAADYRAYVGGTNSFPIWLPFESSGLAASGAMDANASSEPFQTYFPTPTYESPGAPGKHWVQVEVRQSAENVLSWFMNGNLIAQRINQTGFTNGNIMLGFADLYASLADPVNDSFMLYDNVRVELDTPALLPVITGNPTNQTLLVGQTARLSVDATGIGPINYQWRFNGTNLSGATNQALILPNVGMASTGHYDVLVANAVGSVTSIMAQLNVLPANTNPPILSVVGQGMTLRVTWPSDRIGWRLEMQTNFFTAGQRDHWVTLPDSNATNQMLINIGEFESAFFRLVYP